MSVIAAKKAILEAQEVGRQEMSIRRTNVGIAGTIATKITNREINFGNEVDYNPLSIDQQAEKLAQWLTPEESAYILENWK